MPGDLGLRCDEPALGIRWVRIEMWRVCIGCGGLTRKMRQGGVAIEAMPRMRRRTPRFDAEGVLCS